MADERGSGGDRLGLTIRTPHAVPFDEAVEGLRVPTESGQVGLRPHGEPGVLVVEPGLVVVRCPSGLRFAATAGGLLESDRERAELLTPFAVVGDSDQEVLAALDSALATPDSELLARRRLGELELRVLRELREPGGRPPTVMDDVVDDDV